jgi:peptidoglycan/LPS O-acetylase OafA/YrhL
LSTKKLAILVWIFGLGLAAFSLFDMSGANHIGVGWTMAGNNLWGGLLRMSFSYSAGMLISRVFRPMKIKSAFWICSLSLLVLLGVPHLGAVSGAMWLNGLYDSICVLFLFPAILYIGASGSISGTSEKGEKVWKWLGGISYPLYMVHYPIMYLFYAWCWKDGKTFAQTWPVIIAIFIGCILLAYAVQKLYDEPVRRWLSKRLSL